MKYFAIYLLIVNAAGFLLMLIDKRKAIRHRWRIPEKTLFLTAAIGGSVGSIMGMYTFRHKTKHLQFTLGMPAILIVQLVLAFIFFTRIYPL
jgi:uncharacterized membrane protein YsdA (DUF1294 family)